MSAHPSSSAAPVMALRSASWTAFFTWIMRRRMARAFNAVRLLANAAPPDVGDRPLVVYANHPAWWDPALFIVLGDRFFADRIGFGPMDEAALARYRFMRRLGIFGIAPDTPRGARRFLDIGSGLLADPRHMLWLTAQGAFADPRRRPPGLRRGLAGLMARAPAAALALPLAIEYPFWSESRPEAVCAFGTPVDPSAAASHSLEDRLGAGLVETQDRLAAAVQARDPALFDSVIEGRAGVGGVYDLYRRLAAALRGRRFEARHGPGAPGDRP